MKKRPFFPRKKPFTPPPACKCPGREANKVRKNVRSVLGPHPSGSLILPPRERWAYVCPACEAVIGWAEDERVRTTIDFFRPLGMAPIFPAREGRDVTRRFEDNAMYTEF